jgi:hypothetical protein
MLCTFTVGTQRAPAALGLLHHRGLLGSTVLVRSSAAHAPEPVGL